MEHEFLFRTAVPVLLGDRRSAGRVALELYRRHGITPHWFGEGWGLLLFIYASRHPITLPFSPEHDGVTVRLLRAFVKEQKPYGGILTLIPCSPDAEGFLERARSELEEEFVLLEKPNLPCDPIRGLLRA